ncbi:MAG: DUF4339 domain-containing protein [Planctomycetota bacterium]|nr:MAG: DUF4339 domain-containing protein [Planctomycetota bacterium]
MAQDWFYKLLGEETGPLTFQALRELAADGHLASEDEVRTSTSSWRLARDVPELFVTTDVAEPELATGLDLDMLLASSAAPVKLSEKRRALQAAQAAAQAPVLEWYYKILGQEMGPVTSAEVQEQIQQGSLASNDLIRLGTNGEWQPLSRIPHFRAQAAAMQPQPEWFCRMLGQELGPMTFDELQSMVNASSLHADDEVRHAAGGSWERADRTRGLKFTRSAAVVPSGSHDRTATYAPFGADAKRREWYYEMLGQEMGPISFLELSKAIAEGSLQLEDKARKGKAGAWSLVIDVPGLVTDEARAAHVASRLESTRPRPVPVVAPAPSNKGESSKGASSGSASGGPASGEASRVAAAVPLPEAPSPPPAVTPPPRPPAPMSGIGMNSGMGSMAASRPAAPPPPPAFKARRSSSSPSFNFGAMFGGLKDALNPKAIAAIVVILLAGAFLAASQFGLRLGGTPGKKEYAEIRLMYDEIKKLEDTKAPEAEWAAFLSKHQKRWGELKSQIDRQGPGSDKRVLQLMYFAVKDNFPDLSGASRATRLRKIHVEMKEAAQLLGEPGR